MPVSKTFARRLPQPTIDDTHTVSRLQSIHTALVDALERVKDLEHERDLYAQQVDDLEKALNETKLVLSNRDDDVILGSSNFHQHGIASTHACHSSSLWDKHENSVGKTSSHSSNLLSCDDCHQLKEHVKVLQARLIDQEQHHQQQLEILYHFMDDSAGYLDLQTPSASLSLLSSNSRLTKHTPAPRHRQPPSKVFTIPTLHTVSSSSKENYSSKPLSSSDSFASVRPTGKGNKTLAKSFTHKPFSNLSINLLDPIERNTVSTKASSSLDPSIHSLECLDTYQRYSSRSIHRSSGWMV